MHPCKYGGKFWKIIYDGFESWSDEWFFYFPPRVVVGRPGGAWQGLTDLLQYPVVNPDPPPRHHLFVDAAHLFILNPVIIVPLHWPAGKALRSSWRVNWARLSLSHTHTAIGSRSLLLPGRRPLSPHFFFFPHPPLAVICVDCPLAQLPGRMSCPPDFTRGFMPRRRRRHPLITEGEVSERAEMAETPLM